MVLQRLLDHVVDDFARRVEAARRLAGRFPRLGIERPEQVLEHLAEEFRIKRDIGIVRVVLVNREFVGVKERNDALLGMEEEPVRNVRLALARVREPVEEHKLATLALALLPVKTVKERTVEERRLLYQLLERRGILEFLFVTIERLHPEPIAPTVERPLDELALLRLAVEGREEKILENAAIVVVILHRLRIEVLQQCLHALDGE